MKTDYIENMPAGRELDILIAEKVMGEPKPTYTHEHVDVFSIVYSEGKSWCCYPDFFKGDICEWSPKPFSSSILLAWEVVEKMGPSYELKAIHHPSGTVHRATFWRGMMGFPVEAETAPLAICRSALLTTTYKLE